MTRTSKEIEETTVLIQLLLDKVNSDEMDISAALVSAYLLGKHNM